MPSALFYKQAVAGRRKKKVKCVRPSGAFFFYMIAFFSMYKKFYL
jgi:hypothetical protein